MDLLPADIFPFDEELECDYKGEHYSERDNGAHEWSSCGQNARGSI